MKPMPSSVQEQQEVHEVVAYANLHGFQANAKK